MPVKSVWLINKNYVTVCSDKSHAFHINLLIIDFYLFVGITLSLSTLIDGKNFNAGGHKIGVALELEA